MYNQAVLTVSGNVVTDPYFETVGANNIPKLTLRFVWTTRRQDSVTGEWEDANTSFATVTCWRKLAEHVNISLRKGDAVFLRGKLEVHDFVGRDGQRKTSIDVEATSIGPDLTRGVARFQRLKADKPAASAEGESGRDVESGPAGDQPGLAAPADGEPGPDGPADATTFDDTALEALTKDTETVSAPF